MASADLKTVPNTVQAATEASKSTLSSTREPKVQPLILVFWESAAQSVIQKNQKSAGLHLILMTTCFLDAQAANGDGYFLIHRSTARLTSLA